VALQFPVKDPDEVLDYTVDWSARLDDDTISTSDFTLTTAAGVVIDSDSNTTTTTTVWLSGGTAGEQAEILNRITTAAGRTMDQTCRIKLKAK
jgi:hypothetical protein